MSSKYTNYTLQNIDKQSTVSALSSLTHNSSLLAVLNEGMFLQLSPAVAVLVLMMIIGVIGNCLICYIFTRKLRSSSQNFLLLCLGIFDLLSSCVGVPSEIFDIRHYYLYESADACKAMRFLTTFPSLASILVLLVIAVDRYRKICKPLHHQIRLFQARITLIIIVIIAFVFSIPAIFIYGHRSFPTPIPGLNGFDCSVDDAYKDRPYPLVYEGILLAAFLASTIVLTSIYLRIWLETKRHIKYLKSHAAFGGVLLDEPTTTTSSYNCDDSSLENIVDDTLQTEYTKSSVKSLHKKRNSSHSRKKITESSKTMPDIETSKMLKSNKTSSFVGVKFQNTEDQINNETDDSCLQQGDQNAGVKHKHDSLKAVDDVLQIAVLEKSPKSSIKFFKPQYNGNRELIETANNSRGNCNTSEYPSGDTCLPVSDVDVIKSNNSKDNTVSEGNRNLLSSESQSNNSQSHQKINSNLTALSSTNINSDSKTCKDPQSVFINSDNSIVQLKLRLNQSDSRKWRESSVKKHPNNKITTDVGLDNSSVESSLLQNYDILDSIPPTEKDFCGDSEPGPTVRSHHTELSGCVSSPKIKDWRHNDNKFSNDLCCIYNMNTSQRESLKHSGSYIIPLECGDNVSSLSEIANTHKVYPSNTISFVTHPEKVVEHPDNSPSIISQQFSMKNQIRRSQHSKSNQSLLTAKRARKALRATRTTIIACAITVGFILSYLPHLTLIILRSVKTDFEHHLDEASLIVYNIFIRSYFANNVINVFVYGTINLEFRNQVITLWKKFKCK